MKRLILFIPLALAGCSFSMPVTVLLDKGKIMKGVTTASLSEGTFSASDDEGLSCSGRYDPYNMQTTIIVPAMCNDGRTAKVTVSRDTMTNTGGSGTIEMSDGTKGQFLFGAAAEKF